MNSDILQRRRYVNWQEQWIYTLYGTITMNEIISIFVNKALAPFMDKNGYNLSIKLDKLEDIIATFMFHYSTDKNYMFPLSKSVSFMGEHYDHFNYTLNWDSFWLAWDYRLGSVFLYDIGGCTVQIECIIWAYIDLLKSSTYNNYLLQFQDIDATKREDKLDPYIRDQLNRQNHHKFTKFEL